MSYYPIIIALFLNKPLFPSIAFVVVVLVCSYSYLSIAYFYVPQIVLALPMFNYVLCLCYLKYMQPPDSRIPRLFSYFLILFIMGILMTYTLKYLPMNNDFFQFLLLQIILPIARDVTRFIVTRITWYLSSGENVDGKTITSLNRAYSWPLAALIYLFWAVYFRLQVANMKNPALILIVTFSQAFLEITLRLTTIRRDTLIIKLKNQIFNALFNSKKRTRTAKKRKLTKVHSLHSILYSSGKEINSVIDKDISSQQKKEECSTEAEYNEAKEAFYSMIILLEMMAEYTGIVVSFFLIVYWSDNIIYSPFQYYASIVQVDEPQNLYPLALASFIQFFGEIIVDTICMYFEKRTDPIVTWKGLKRKRMTIFIFLYAYTSLYSSIAAYEMIANRVGGFDSCYGRNMCYCVGNGLVQDGIREKYCHILYPNNSGLP